MLTDLSRRRQVLREQVNADFEQLRSAVDTLGEAVQDRTDIGRVMQRQPYVWLGCALLIGFAFGVRHMPFKDT
jgi:hypothetical protein